MTTEQSIGIAKDMISKMVDQCELEGYTVQDLQILLTFCDTALDISFDHDKYTLNQADVYSNNDFSSVYLYYWMYEGWTGHCVDAIENQFTFRYERGDRALKLMKRQIAPQETDEYFMDHLAWIVLETRATNSKPIKISFASWPIENIYRDKTMMPMIRVLKFSMMYCLYLIGIGSITIGQSVEFENDDQMRIIFEEGEDAYMDRAMRTYFNENGWDNDKNLKEMYKIEPDPDRGTIITNRSDDRYTAITDYIANKRRQQNEAKRSQLNNNDYEADHRPIITPPTTNGPKGTLIALNGDGSNLSQVSKMLSEMLGIELDDGGRHYSLIGGDTNNDAPPENITNSNRPRRPSWSIVNQATSNVNPTEDMINRIRDTVFGIVGVIKNTVRINWKEFKRIHDAIVDYVNMPYNDKEMNTVYGSEFIDNKGLILSISIVANKNDATNYAVYFDDPGYHVIRVKGPIAKTFINKFSRNDGQKYPEFIICDVASGSNFSLGDPRLVEISKNATEDKVHADGLFLIATAFAVIYSEKMNQIRILTPDLIINENTFGRLLNFCETGGIFTSKTMISRTISLMDDIINNDLTSYPNNVKYSIGEFYIYMETPEHDFVWDHEGLEWMLDPRGGDESLFGYGSKFALYRDYYKVESDSPYYSSYGVYRDLRKILRYMLATMEEE